MHLTAILIGFERFLIDLRDKSLDGENAVIKVFGLAVYAIDLLQDAAPGV